MTDWSDRPFINIRRDKGGHIVVSLPASLEGGESMPPSLEEAIRHAKVLKVLVDRAREEEEETGQVSLLVWHAIDLATDNLINALPPDERRYSVRRG